MRRREAVRWSAGVALMTMGVVGLMACGSAGGRPDASAASAGPATSPAPSATTTPASGTDEGAGTAALAPVPIDATLAPGLPSLDGPAAVWRFPAGPSLDEARLLALGEVLGLGGPAQQVDPGEGGGWRLGPADGPQLRVRDDALLSWSYSSESPDTPVSCTPPCEAKLPPGTPSSSEARAKAEALLRAAGGDPGRVAWSETADPAGRAVTASPLLGGLPSPAGLSVMVGPSGVVTASGTLASPQPAGERPRLGTAAAVEQFRAGGSPASGAAGAEPGAATAREPAATEPVSEPVSGSSATPVPPTRLPATTACLPAPDGTEICQSAGPASQPVHLVAVEPGLGQVPSADGTVWLLPTYRFTTATGGVLQVLAVDASTFFKTPQPATAGG